MNSFDPGNILSPKNLQLGPRLIVINPFIGLKSRHLNSEDDFGMKTASNLKNNTIFRQRVHAKLVPASAKSGLLYEITTSPLSLLLRPNKAHVRPNAFHFSTFCMSNFLWSRTV